MDELIDAIYRKDLSLFHKHLDYVILEPDSITPLMYAAHHNFFEAVPQLHAYEGRKVLCINSYFPRGATALQIAASNGSYQVCKLLSGEVEASGFSLVLHAVCCKDAVVMRYLLCKFRYAYFETKLYRARGLFYNLQLSSSRVSQNAFSFHFYRLDSLRRGFMHYMAAWSDVSPELMTVAEQFICVAKELSLQAVIDVEGNSCLHIAAQRGNMWFCQQIADKCPEIIDIPAACRLTAGMLAFEQEHIDIARLLGGDMKEQYISQVYDARSVHEERAAENEPLTSQDGNALLPYRVLFSANSPTTDVNSAHGDTKQASAAVIQKLDPGVLSEGGTQTLKDLALTYHVDGSMTDSLQISTLREQRSTLPTRLDNLSTDNAALNDRLEQAKADLQEVVAEYERRLSTLANLITQKSENEEQLTYLIQELIQSASPKYY